MSDERPVVCDTTPLIMLAGVGLLDLLRQLYGTIMLPELVVREFDAKRSPGEPDLATLAWMTIRPQTPAPELLAALLDVANETLDEPSDPHAGTAVRSNDEPTSPA